MQESAHGLNPLGVDRNANSIKDADEHFMAASSSVYASTGGRAGMNVHPQCHHQINNPRHKDSSHEEVINEASPHQYEDQDHSSILQELTIANLRSDLELAEESESHDRRSK